MTTTYILIGALVAIITFMVGFVAGALFEDHHDLIRNKKVG